MLSGHIADSPANSIPCVARVQDAARGLRTSIASTLSSISQLPPSGRSSLIKRNAIRQSTGKSELPIVHVVRSHGSFAGRSAGSPGCVAADPSRPAHLPRSRRSHGPCAEGRQSLALILARRPSGETANSSLSCPASLHSSVVLSFDPRLPSSQPTPAVR